MICSRCLLRASTRHGPSLRAALSTTTRLQNPAEPVTANTTTATNPRPNSAPAATSTSAAQPFSTPLTPSPSQQPDLPVEGKQSTKPAHLPKSSVAAGAVLKGLNFMKNKQDPVALEDQEYPAWLWTSLARAKEKGEGAGDEEGDLYAKSKKQRRKAAKALRRQQMLNPELLQPKIPLYEQSVDLPAGDGTLEGNRGAGEARQELTQSMRKQRRAKIKEGNFLKAMR